MKLLDYIKGDRKGREAHRIERRSLDDVFLRDALEGYDQVKGDHLKSICRLNSRVIKTTSNSRKYFGLSIVATIIVLLSLIIYFLIFPSDSHNQLSQSMKSEINLNIRDSIKNLTEIAPILDSLPTDIKSSNKVHANKEKIKIENVNDNIDLVESNISESIINLTEKVESKVKQNESNSPNTLLHGKVVDSQGESLPGAVIYYKDSKKGVLSDQEGEFSIESLDKPLVVEYLGYEKLEVKADSNMLLVLNEEPQTLSEVVVVGYGTQAKRSFIGSISTITETFPVSKPQPVGGRRAYKKYLKLNLNKLTDGPCKNNKGRVILEFTVGNDGRPENIRVKKSLCSDADNEAIRLLNEGPNWIVGESVGELTVYF